MNRSNVIRVDWSAWAASEASSRRACGVRAFLLPVFLTPKLPRVRVPFADNDGDPPDAEEKTIRRAEEAASPHLPGVDAWLARRKHT